MDLQAFLITFREALEALLIVGIITSYLKRVNRPEFTKYVWLGAGLAVIASLGLALVFQVILDGFASMGSQNYMKVGIMIISGILLTQMVFWMAAQAKDMSGKVQGKFDQFITAGNVIGMVIHAFLVVIREGVETVFFFAAITGGDIGQAMQSWGSLAGIALAAVVSFFFFRGTMRIPLKTFFKVTGAFIVLIAAGLIVQAVSILQDMNIIGSVVPHLYDLTWLMPEHPIDQEHYIRDTGHVPLISGDVGVFLKALFGYASSPSLEEFLIYWGYYVALYLLLRGRGEHAEKAHSTKSQTQVKEA
ncbi:iron permease [Aneurinibacillus migulanus]|uniref:FTR1 family iron permease n=1 Tax=Aneurinibacillus migulanus TaxID=47500 RepID=UPI0005BE262F|nr:FTR1 family protein [Aneurinibacillus migulanus]KIV58026.1 iron permease [Aneurinibacillus migulanus]KPD06244.1 iron permease [Aneurinibacillus migulanus]